MSSNPDHYYRDVKRWRATMKKRLVIGFGGKCTICGLCDDAIVYDFHHLDPNTKDFAMTAKIRSWEKIIAEVKKCVMVCSHCHRKIHAGLVTVPDSAPMFSEELVAASDYAIAIGRSFNACPVCGKIKYEERKTCSNKCAGSLIATGKKPKDIAATVEEVKLVGFWAVAKKLEVSDNTLRKWIKGSGFEVPRFRASPNRQKTSPPLAQQ